MRLLFFLCCAYIPSCVNASRPALSTIQHAPESVRESIVIDISGSSPRIIISISLFTPTDKLAWIDQGIEIEQDRVFLDGKIALNDDDKLTSLGRVLVDTGFNGYLGLPVNHWVVECAWISAELGKRSVEALGGRRAMWAGALAGFVANGVLVSPVPLTVMGDPWGWEGRTAPSIGQLWFDLAEATWIDLSVETIAVSFQSNIVRDTVSKKPELWVGVPWEKTVPDGHRFISLYIGGQIYYAIIDTGSVGDLFLETSHPPFFVDKPWVRSRLAGAQLGSLFRATSKLPVSIGGIEVEEVEITWRSRPSRLFADSHPGQSFALLGVPFLRRFPVLLDHRNNRAYFYIGDRADLPRFKDQSAIEADDLPTNIEAKEADGSVGETRSVAKAVKLSLEQKNAAFRPRLCDS